MPAIIEGIINFNRVIRNDVFDFAFDLKTNILGGGIFGRYHFTENLFAHVEVEYLDFKIDTYTIYNNGLEIGKENIGITSLFVGGGYKQEIGNNSFFTLMILYNLNEQFV